MTCLYISSLELSVMVYGRRYILWQKQTETTLFQPRSKSFKTKVKFKSLNPRDSKAFFKVHILLVTKSRWCVLRRAKKEKKKKKGRKKKERERDQHQLVTGGAMEISSGCPRGKRRHLPESWRLWICHQTSDYLCLLYANVCLLLLQQSKNGKNTVRNIL